MELGPSWGSWEGSTFNFASHFPKPRSRRILHPSHSSETWFVPFPPKFPSRKWSFKFPRCNYLCDSTTLHNHTKTMKSPHAGSPSARTPPPPTPAVTGLVVGSLQLSQTIPLIGRSERSPCKARYSRQHASLTLATLTLAYHFCREFESLPSSSSSASIMSHFAKRPPLVITTKHLTKLPAITTTTSRRSTDVGWDDDTRGQDG